MATLVMSLIILAKYYIMKTIMISLFSILINYIVDLIFPYNLLLTFATLNAVIYPGLKYIKTINNNFLNMNDQERLFVSNIFMQAHVQKFIVQHNNFCQLYQQLFELLKNGLFQYYLTIIPISLLIIHQVFFEELLLEYKVIYMLFTSFALNGTIVNQYLLANFSRLTHRTAVPLSRIQWRLKGLPFGLRHKIKVMSYFERLSSNRKFGVTIGPTITITIPIFSQVTQSIKILL